MYIAMHVLECLVLHLQQIKDYIVKFVHHGHGICIYIYILSPVYTLIVFPFCQQLV